MTACSGCALTDGACANREPHNQITAIICARAGIPFYCHDTAIADWQNPVEFKAAILRRQPVPICQGWVREVRALQAAGWFATERALKRDAGEAALRTLQAFIQASNGGDEYGKAHAREDLEELVTLLCRPPAVPA